MLLDPSPNFSFWVFNKGFISNHLCSFLFQMSNSNNNNASGSNSSGSFSLMNLYGRVIFDGSNFNDWIHNIRMVTHYEDKEYVLDEKLKEINVNTASTEEITAF